MAEAIKKEKKKERRISLFLGYYDQENHFVDDTIYNYFNNIPNKANIIKKLLYEYATNQNGCSVNIATIPPDLKRYVLVDEMKIDVMESGMMGEIDKFKLNGLVYEPLTSTDNVASKVTPNVTDNVTESVNVDKVTHIVTDNVTEEVTLKETEKEPLDVTPKDTSEVTEEEDDDIEIVSVKPKEKKATEDDKTKKANAFMNSLNNFTW